MLYSVRSQRISIRSNILRSLILPLPPKPKQRYKYRRAASQKAGVIHRGRRNGHGERKAEYHDKDYDVHASDSVYDEADRPSHPETAWRYFGPSA